MVLEWQQAYMDYDFLKNLLKEILKFKQKTKPGPTRSRTLYRAFSGLVNHKLHMPTHDVETPVIVVNNVNHRSETMFLMAADEGGEQGLVYFKKLDAEFNKAVKFYKEKVGEVMEEAEVLNKQMHALIAFRAKVEDPNPNNNDSSLEAESSKLASEVAASKAALASTTPATRLSIDIDAVSIRMDVIDEGTSTNQAQLDMMTSGYDDNGDASWEVNPINSNNIHQSKKNKMAPFDILARVKFNNTTETPRSTIKGFFNIPSQTELKFTCWLIPKIDSVLLLLVLGVYFLLVLGFW